MILPVILGFISLIFVGFDIHTIIVPINLLLSLILFFISYDKIKKWLDDKKIRKIFRYHIFILILIGVILSFLFMFIIEIIQGF
jgi:hypothetical protein